MLFGGAATGIFVFGIVMAVLGTLFGLPEMRSRLQMTLAQQGTMFLLLFLGIFIATVIAGPVIDAIGNKAILVVSSLLVAAGMAGFTFAHSFGTAAIPAVLLGCGGGGLNTSTNALVSDLFGDRRGPMLNLLGIFYGIGALCIPLFAAAITGHFQIAPQLLFCAGLGSGVRAAFSRHEIPADRRRPEILVARRRSSSALSWRLGAGIFAILPIRRRSQHRRMDVHLCGFRRLRLPDGHLHPSRILGHTNGREAGRRQIAKIG